MSKYPYVEAYDKLPEFFQAVREARMPEKFTYRYFANIGFPSSKDRDFVKALKRLDFIDENSRPTRSYQDLKDAGLFPSAIRKSIEKTYKELLDIDKEAWDVPENVLNGYFGRMTGESLEKTLVLTRTFKGLAALSDHEKKEEKNGTEEVEGKQMSNINLSINLPTTTDEKVYETLFKHLKDLLVP